MILHSDDDESMDRLWLFSL